ncbi:hypothetical protein HMPREF1531_00525 [Propionibacterium sp. oral taxon 192 str. F0372]|nr:hypothetical protein HMPREF1531_00525 [Propionibacterium sp. oral taxon 192 str. F0372]
MMKEGECCCEESAHQAGLGHPSYLPQPLHQLLWIIFQPVGDAYDLVQAEITLAPFDLADVHLS